MLIELPELVVFNHFFCLIPFFTFFDKTQPLFTLFAKNTAAVFLLVVKMAAAPCNGLRKKLFCSPLHKIDHCFFCGDSLFNQHPLYDLLDLLVCQSGYRQKTFTYMLIFGD